MATTYFGVRDAKLAVWNSTGDYGSLIDIYGIRRVEIQTRTVGDTLTGDDKELETHAQVIGCTVNIEFADDAVQTFEMLAALLNATATSSGGTDTELGIGGDFAYVGFVAQTIATAGGADKLVYTPKSKASEGLRWSHAYGGFSIQNLSLNGVADGTLKPYYVRKRSTTSALSVFPTPLT